MKRLQRQLKRVLAFVLSVAMLAGGIWYGTTSEAADSQISFSASDAVNYWAASDGESAYVLWLKADVGLTSAYYTGVKYEVSDGTDTKAYEFNAVGIYNGMFNMRIPYANLPKPSDMTSTGKTYTLTFKAGGIGTAEGTNVTIKEDFSILLKDGNRIGIVDTIHTDVTYIAGAKSVINIWPTPAPALTAGDGYYHRAVSGQLRYGDGSATQTAKLDGIYRFAGADYYYMPLPEVVHNSMKTGSIVVFEDVLVQDAVDASRLVRLPNLCYQYTEGADPCWKKIEEPKEMNYTAMDLTYYNASNDEAKTYWDMYFDTDAEVPGTAWSTTFADVKANVGENPIALSVKKSNGKQLNVFINDTTTLPIPPAKGTVLTIRKGKYKDTTDTYGIEIKNDYSIFWNGSKWSTEVPVRSENVTIKSIQLKGYNEESRRWNVYVDVEGNIPGAAWDGVFKGLTYEVNGHSLAVPEIYKHNDSTLFFYLNDDILPQTITKNIKVVLKAGTATHSKAGTNEMNLTNDFTMYINQYGWSTEDYPKAPVYEKLSFTGLDPETGYNSGAGLWYLYITPSRELPGTADSTAFTGLQMSIDGGKKQAVTITKASHGNSAFIYFGTDVLKEKITKDTKLIIHAGKATANDNSDGVELSKDFTIYINAYGCSAKGFIRPTSYKQVTFTGLDPATGFSSVANAWCLYIEPSKTLPGTADSTFFTGLEMSVDGKNRQKVRVTKASHGNSAFIYFGTDVLPSKLTKNTKLTIHAGKAIASDESAGIWLTKDCNLYANQYGISTKGYMKPVKVVQKSVKLALDRNTSFGGNENGLYLTTTDKFPVDTTWATRIKALSYDKKSGIFLNGQKIDGQLIRFADGKVYVALADAGVTAKDKDKVTIKGTFALESTGITYKEVSFYFNGKTWNTKYEKAKKETYQSFAVKEVNTVTGWNEEFKRWNVYLDVNALLPGKIDNIYFENLVVEVNGKKIDTTVYHSYQDTLFFPIEGKYLPKNVKDGTKITIKAGKAIATDKATGIRLTKDFTFYTYKGSMSSKKPTNNTKWQKLTINGMLATGSYHKDSKVWDFHIKLRQPLTTKTGTNYLQLPIKVNGKSHTISALQDGEYLYLSIPDSALAGTTKKATLTIEKGAKAYANAGHDGFEVQETWTTYVYNGAISEREFKEIEKYEGNIMGVQNVMPYTDGYHVYLRLNKEFPGSAWYEKYEEFTYYYNNKEVKTTVRKSDSSNGKFMYFPIEKYLVGESKEGDTVKIKKNTKLTCGGFEFKVTNDFMLMYNDGIWSQYVDTDVKAPKDIGSLWSIARFEEGYIPVASNGSVLYSNEDTYNKIVSTEAMKDYTISFNAKKFYDDETSPSFGVILRGNPVNDTDPMTKELLYGYVVTFSAFEYKEDPASKEAGVWTGYLNLWKNGENYSLLDQYRVSYVYDQSDHPYFQYEKDYNYEFSIYNITETCVCITIKVNGKLVMRYYDEAGSDPFDPAINAGTFEVYAGCPNYITDDIVELSEILAEKTECMVGDRVRVAATYPSVLEGAEFTVDKEGATITEGAFVATKPGTYTVSGTYNGKELTPITITVTKPETEEIAKETSFPVLPVAVAGVIVLAGLVAIVLLVRKKKNTKESNK